MVRFIVCIGVLLGILAMVRSGLYSFLDAYGFWPYMLLCGVVAAITAAAAFSWDHYEARRRRPYREGPQ